MTNATMRRELTSGRYCEQPAPDSGVRGCDSRGRHYGANAPERHGATVYNRKGATMNNPRIAFVTLMVQVNYDENTWGDDPLDSIASDLSARLFAGNDEYAPEALEVTYTETRDQLVVPRVEVQQ